MSPSLQEWQLVGIGVGVSELKLAWSVGTKVGMAVGLAWSVGAKVGMAVGLAWSVGTKVGIPTVCRQRACLCCACSYQQTEKMVRMKSLDHVDKHHLAGQGR